MRQRLPLTFREKEGCSPEKRSYRPGSKQRRGPLLAGRLCFAVVLNRRLKTLSVVADLLVIVAMASFVVLQGAKRTVSNIFPSYDEPSDILVHVNFGLEGELHSCKRPKRLRSKDKILSKVADFGSIEPLRLLPKAHFHRTLHADPKMSQGLIVPWNSDPNDRITPDRAVDDDYFANDNWEWRPEHERDRRVKDGRCRSPSWAKDRFPNCNIFHEFDRLGLLGRRTLRHINYGSYKDVFGVADGQDEYIFKTLVYDSSGGTETYIHDDFEDIRIDALVTEKFASNPLFMDMYGYCGVSIFTEFMPNGDLDELASPRWDRHDPFENFTEAELLKMNDIEPNLKLKLSLQVAEAVAYLHGFESGVIVHGDIQATQFLLTTNASNDWRNGDVLLKINDFNRAVMMQYDEEHGEYCRYFNGGGAGTGRPPEEYFDGPLSEKIDVYSVGVVIYYLINGYGIHPEENDRGKVQEMVIKGIKPKFDDRITGRSFAERRLSKIASKCFTYDSEKRPDIFQVVNWLREAYEHSLAGSSTS